MNQHSVTKNPINLSRNVGIRAEDPFAKVQLQNRNVVGKKMVGMERQGDGQSLFDLIKFKKTPDERPAASHVVRL
jgi:hypothetical protein